MRVVIRRHSKPPQRHFVVTINPVTLDSVGEFTLADQRCSVTRFGIVGQQLRRTAMKRGIRKETPQARNLGRRESASAEQAAAPSQNRESRDVGVDAMPEPIMVDTARAAVIVCDMQNDFGTKGGMFDRAGL